jgi:RNA polymerase sigma factor (sigma-70 family)
LFARFQPLVRRVIRRYQHLPAAEDLPGEVYLVFARLVNQYDVHRGIPFPRYLACMLPAALHTVMRRDARVHSREILMGDDPWEEFTTCDAFTARGGGRGRDALADDPSRSVLFGDTLHHLLQQLTPRQADVFFQRALLGQDYLQIAEKLGCTPGAVRVVYFSACHRLRKKWQDLADDPWSGTTVPRRQERFPCDPAARYSGVL